VGGDCTYGIDLVDGSNEDTNGHGDVHNLHDKCIILKKCVATV